MKEDNGVQGMIGGKTLTWAGIIAVAILLALTLGGLIYNFVVSIP